jgi:hypothetical protein
MGYYHEETNYYTFLNIHHTKDKKKLSLQQAVGVHKVVRRRDSHIS